MKNKIWGKKGARPKYIPAQTTPDVFEFLKVLNKSKYFKKFGKWYHYERKMVFIRAKRAHHAFIFSNRTNLFDVYIGDHSQRILCMRMRQLCTYINKEIKMMMHGKGTERYVHKTYNNYGGHYGKSRNRY